jgi:hypothetical protein
MVYLVSYLGVICLVEWFSCMAVFEIVELSDGDIALKRSDDVDGEPLVRITFSGDAKSSFPQQHVEIAKAMIEAGVRKVGELSGVVVEDASSIAGFEDRTVH